MAHYIFWGTVVTLQLLSAVIALSMEPAQAIIPVALGTISLVACMGLFLKRRIYKLNFWAGAFGISALYGIVIVFSLVVMLFGAFALSTHGLDALFMLGAGVAVVQLLGIFGMFIYVFGSPHIWRVEDQASSNEVA